MMAMSIVNRVFDGVLVINLDRSKDRMQTMAKQLDALHIRYERMSGVDGTAMKDVDAVTTPSCSKLCAIGAIGCAQSHRKCWEHMLKQQWKNVLILEDDAVFGNNFDHRFLTAWLHVPSDWEHVYIGCGLGCGDRDQYEFLDYLISNFKLLKPAVKTNTKHVRVPDSAHCLHAYAVTATCAKKLLARTHKLPLLGHIDSVISTMPLKRYAFTDTSLVKQDSEVSSISSNGSPHLGNALLNRIRTKRGISGGWVLSAPLFRVHKNVNVEGWSIVFFATGFLAGYLTRRWLLCTALFLLCMGLDHKTYGKPSTLNVYSFVFRTLCFTLGALLGSRVANKSA